MATLLNVSALLVFLATHWADC